MNLFENTVAGEWIYALGWTVLHSLWQATIVALIVGILLLKMQKRAAWQRYWVAHFGWLSILCCSMVTFVWYYKPQGDQAGGESITRLIAEGEAALASSPSLLGSFLQVLSDYFNQHLPLIVSLWALGMGVFLLRFLGGLIFLQHLRSYRVQSLPVFWEVKLGEIREKLGLKKQVQLLESALVKVPIVIGWLKPLILVPVGALNGLSTQQVEAILAHELAHIKRHDYLLNLIRSLVEILFYFNPAVWWLSAQIRTEREHCCDDMALTVCGDSLSYVRALVALQEMSQRPANGLAMGLVGSKPELLNRVRRILNQPKDKSDIMEKLIITCLLLICLSFTLLSAGLPVEKNVETEAAVRELLPESTFMPGLSTYTVSVKEIDGTFNKNLMMTVKADLRMEAINSDTLPQGNIQMQVAKDGKNYDVRIKNNQIQELSIDGKSIPREDLVNYYDLVQNLLDEMPEPPAPPAPPRLSPADVPAPPAPPAPPGRVTGPTPPAPPAPPAPPTPATPAAVAPPPPAPRLKLEKPARGEEGSHTHSYRIEIPDQEKSTSRDSREFVWQSVGDPAPEAIWVTNDDNNIADRVVVVQVRDEDALHALDDYQNVVVELKIKKHEVNTGTAVDQVSNSNVFLLEKSPASTFISHSDLSEVLGEKETWQPKLDRTIFANGLMTGDGNYELKLTNGQLLINGKPQSKEIHEKYFQMLQESPGKPLDDHYFYFINRNIRNAE